MPFQKGNKLAVGIKSGGRKGYEYEADQIKQMKRHINSIFKLFEKIETGEASDDEKERFAILQKLTLKMMDKIHANKQHVEHDVGDKTLDRMTEAMVKIANPKPIVDLKIKPKVDDSTIVGTEPFLALPSDVIESLKKASEKTLPQYPEIISNQDEPSEQTSI